MRAHDDRGGVTAEFAIALPAVVVVLVACLGGLGLASHFVRVQDAAAAAAREAGRGGGVGVASRLVSGATAVQWTEGEFECVRVTAAGSIGPVRIPISATSCALGGGQ